jgi:anaerobic selenocysteine-containing dehydrogenase
LILVFEGKRSAVSSSQLPPILSKVYQESNLWPGSHAVSMHPQTAAAFGLNDGDRVFVQTNGGEHQATLRCKAGIMPGVVQMGSGPNPVLMGQDKAEFGWESQEALQDVDGYGFSHVVLRKA